MFKSIRSRLALSFAGIALIAAIVLGAILLVILQQYYVRLELDYLRGNAQTISGIVMKMISTNAAPDEIQSQIENLAFLTQTRVQVYSLGQQLLYDSGSPRSVNLNLGSAKQLVTENGGAISVVPQSKRELTAPTIESSPKQVTANALSTTSKPTGLFVYRSIRVAGSPFGFNLSAETIPVGAAHSNLTIAELIQDPQTARALGIVKLSEGPAYGSEILRSVAEGWILASLIAVLLAVAIGLYISRRISAPVLALTDVTTRMTQGDFSVRASVSSQDEYGQLGRSFNEMAQQIEETVTTLRRFVADAAHELRTPLTVLRTNLDLVSEEKDAAKRAALTTDTHAMLHRLEDLNANLLDLSRLEAHDSDNRDIAIDLTKLLQERSEIYASQAEQAGLVFEQELPSGSVLIRGNTTEITRAVDNLVDNACKFTPQEGTVRVTLSRQDEQAVISVVDNGIGIPEDELPQLFNRFHRGRNTSAYSGSGLGLAIVKAIVTAHGGYVEAQSAGDEMGSRFLISLPVVESLDV